MTYICPNCGAGRLRPTQVTFLRRWGQHMVTLPRFAAWQCDACCYTRYDGAALAQIELVLGPDVEAFAAAPLWRSKAVPGPGERGPHRWSD